MCKIILVGNDAVGKTSIISKYYNEMDENYNYSITKEKIKKKVERKNKIIELDIWDTVGQEKYRSANKIFMKSTEIALLIYDITNRKSFEDLEFWYNEVIENCNNTIVVIAIAANKSDLYEQQVVDFSETLEFGKNKNINIIKETNSFDFENINDLFNEILLEYVDKKYSDDHEINENDYKEDDKLINENENFKINEYEIFQKYNKISICEYV
jgi:small GTP-binding protein